MPKEKIRERELAQELFVEKLWDAKTIAEYLDLQESTVGKWKKAGDWDKIRDENISNPIKLKKIILTEMLSLSQGKDATINADALAKLYKVVEGLQDKINPGIVAAIMKLYDEFLAKENPQLALQNLAFNKKFLIHIINTYG